MKSCLYVELCLLGKALQTQHSVLVRGFSSLFTVSFRGRNDISSRTNRLFFFKRLTHIQEDLKAGRWLLGQQAGGLETLKEVGDSQKEVWPV